MPSSNLLAAPYVVNLVETCPVPPDRVLDVGPGWGKYAVLLREYLNNKPGYIDAVEGWWPYILDHRLTRLYDTVWHGVAGDPDGPWCAIDDAGHAGMSGRPDEVAGCVDLVLMVDVIEHMTPEQAVTFLGQCPQAWVVVCTPLTFFQNPPHLPPTERHVSHWTTGQLAALGRPIDYVVEDETLGAVLARLAPVGWSR